VKTRSLRRRIAVAFLGLALFSGLFGGLLAVLFSYATEDYIFNHLAMLEVQQLQSRPPGQPLPEPELPFARYYSDDDLPDVLRAQVDEEPGRVEVFGDDGRHYHLRRVHADHADPVRWVVLEVEDLLAVRPAINQIMTVLALIIFSITALATAAGLFLANRVTRPLRRLADEVVAAAPEALPTEWNAPYPPDEVGRLADALREAFGRIHAFIDREQRFTQDASHELRTPLAVIESSADLLARSPDPEHAAELIDRIQSAALSMHLSVDVLLALAREVDPADRNRRTAVLPIVERTIVNHSALLDGRAVEVSVAVDSDWTIAGDSAALQVLIANLISNAFRFTERGEIRIEREGEDLVVIDSGSGIDEDLRRRATERAVKGGNSPGMGLGLSIVDRLCQRYGWRFELESTPPGTTARLRLGGAP
jgi:signal transduction histidine kinase